MTTRHWLMTGLMATVFATGGLTLPATTPIAYALCAAPAEPFEGVWTNVDARTRGVRRVQIDFQCNDVKICPAGEPCLPISPSGLYIRPFGACSPTDCDWGSQFARYSRVRRNISAQFNPGFSIKTVEASILRGGRRDGQLMLVHQTRFTDGSGRRNYSMTEYFTRRR